MAAALSAWQIPCQFYLALQNKNVTQAENLIENGADVDFRYRVGNKERPAICISAQNGDYFMCLLLIHKGCSVNQIDSDGMTPLFYACLNADFELVTLFIKNGANLHICDYLERSAIHFAVQGKNMDIIRIILEACHNINKKDTSGNTALSIACASAHELSPDIVVFLICAGASLNVADASGHFPLHYSHLMSVETLTIILHSHFTKVMGINFHNQPLYNSPSHNIEDSIEHADKGHHSHKNDVKKVVTSSALNFNCRTKFGETPLHILLKNDGHSSNASKPLISTVVNHDQSRNIDTMCRNESPLLHRLSTRIDNSLRAYLATASAVESGNQNGDYIALSKIHTLLDFARQSYYLGGTIDLDAQDNLGCTPLHQAITTGKMCCAEYLIKLGGARCDIKDSLGFTALHYLCQRVDKLVSNYDFVRNERNLSSERQEPSSRCCFDLRNTLYVMLLVYRSTMGFARGFSRGELIEMLEGTINKLSAVAGQSQNLVRFPLAIVYEIERMIDDYRSHALTPPPLTWWSRAKLRDHLGAAADTTILELFQSKGREVGTTIKLPLSLKEFLLYHS